MSRAADPRLEFDPEAGVFRVTYPKVRTRARTDHWPTEARKSIGSLLMREFGKGPTRQVPAHLRAYIPSGKA